MSDTFLPLSELGLAESESAAPAGEPGELRIDEPVDRYVVEASIGDGATARVYRVRHGLLGTRHALKVLRSRSPELRERLVQEGRIQAGLGHPNVVPVTDVLDVHGHLGLLMDYVDGGALDDWLAKGRRPLDQALEVFRGILDGVSAAHRMGIVHRDLKPANVLLRTDDLVPRVTDFGLARHLQQDDGRKTRVGQIMGTPAYMAPEQVDSARDVTARADVFALGAILYELCCGQRAFVGDTVYQVLHKVGRGEFLPPAQHVPDLPVSVQQAILGCLVVDPERRLPSCEAVGALLAPSTARPAAPVPRPATPPPAVAAPRPGDGEWVQVQLSTDGSGALVVRRLDSSRGTSGPERPVALGTAESLTELREQVRLRPSRDPAPASELRGALVRAIYEAAELPAGGPDAPPVLLRLRALDPVTAAFPWEGLGGSERHHVVWSRAVPSSRPVVPRELSGALRVLELGGVGAEDDPVRQGLEPLVRSGHVEWLPPCPIVGMDVDALRARLEAPPRPHVLLVRAPLSVDTDGQLRLGRSGGRVPALGLRDLSAVLDRRACPDLRVVVVEPRYRGELPGLIDGLLSLAGDAATAGLCWPWPVEDGDAERSTVAFLEELAGSGDVIAAASAARRASLGLASTAMLVMRGTSPRVFDLSRRQLRPVSQASAARLSAGQSQLREHLARVMSQAGGYSLFLGDGLDIASKAPAQVALYQVLRSRLDARDHDSLAQLMQRFELLEDREELRALVQDTLDDFADDASLGTVESLAQLCAPGLHVSLTLLPVLADALALCHPDRDVLVLQPLRPGDLERMRTFLRPAGEKRWRRGERNAAERLDFSRQHVVLRLRGGVPAPGRSMLGDPVLTETDQLEHLGALDTMPSQVLAHFRRNPVVFLGFSPDDWGHRAIVRGLAGGQPLTEGSLAVLQPQADALHRRYWTWERGPAGARGVRLVQYTDLTAVTQTLGV
ncbi:MAG: protein kinase [Alphaproteobacteria bacterium]|nr:protein kinase [Alphaproteobacteria bacterium]